MLGDLDAQRLSDNLNINFDDLPLYHSRGVGGRARTRVADAILDIGEFSISIKIGILEPPHNLRELLSVPSLLGRSVISRFGLVVDERTDRVLLLDADEMGALNLPA